MPVTNAVVLSASVHIHRKCPADPAAALVQAPIFFGVAPEVLQEAETRRTGDSPGAARLRRALVTSPMTVETVGM